MNILLADDHLLVRRGLRDILLDQFPRARIGEARDSAQALQETLAHDWDLVILDIAMPGRGGLDALREIKAQRPKLPVLILSVQPEMQFATRALRLGASGYLTKNSAFDELITAVHKVLAGGRYVSGALAEQMAADLGEPAGDRPRHESLSHREFEILRLMASGLAAKEIAARLALSVSTVSTYRARVLKKMRMRTNAELTHYAISCKLVD